MADSLANIAMDTKKSTQVLEADLSQLPTTWNVVLDALEGGINHWTTMHSHLALPDTDETRKLTKADLVTACVNAQIEVVGNLSGDV